MYKIYTYAITCVVLSAFAYKSHNLALNIVETFRVEFFVLSLTVSICLHIFTFIGRFIELHNLKYKCDSL